MIKYRVVSVYHPERAAYQFPLQESYKDALDCIRGLWLPDHCYDNPVTFKFKDLPNGDTLVQHQTTDFRIERVEC